MNEKMTSAITKVKLNQATFHDKSFNPTFINFLYGNNGCGKSTVANVLKEKTNLEWETGHTADDYQMLVYNKDFIERNIASYSNMPGVFTISEQNAQIQKEIKNTTAELRTAQATYSEKSTKLKEQKGLLENEYNNFLNICWNKTKDFRKAVDAAMVGKKKKDTLAKAILAETSPKNFDEANLIALCDTAFDKNATIYPELNKGDEKSIPSSPILEKKIISSSDSQFATFMKAINATDWVRQGHESFHNESKGKCPYCQRELPENFEDEIAQCFNIEYETDLSILRTFKANYGKAVNVIWRAYNKNLSNTYPSIENELLTYSKLLNNFKTTAELNSQRLNEKIAHPDRVIELEDLVPIIEELNEMIDTMNVKIKENNNIVNNKKKKQSQCKTDVICYLSFVLKYEIWNYRNNYDNFKNKIEQLTNDINVLINKIRNLRLEISNLQKNVVNTSAAVEGINTLLNDTGFQGFYLREKENIPNVYEVIRTETGKIAENLSEGERNFIAFLYFHQLVSGSLEADGVAKDKIVVIDDPVSSMDSSSLFVVGA